MTPPLLKRDATGESLYASRAYKPGDVVFSFQSVAWRRRRDRYTVEHENGLHIFDPVLAKTAHSCDPNCRVDLQRMVMVAVREIRPGEAITFDYQTTESEIGYPFDCACGSLRCRGRIG